MTLFLLNLVLAFLWSIWQGFGLDTLAFGFLAGLALLRLCLPLYPAHAPYFRRVWGFTVYCFVFAREMWNSTKSVANTVFRGDVEDLHPNLVTLDTEGLTDLEILLLTHCITLTPGTTSVDVAEDKSWILVHALDGRDAQAVRDSIEGALRDGILRFTR
jgi:multisubunit Na+/H+ antiporter MnhE subunit